MPRPLPISRLLPIVAAAAIILFSGMYHGLRTDRWAVSDALKGAADRLDKLPLNVGDWEGHEETLDPRQEVVAQIQRSKLRRYVNKVDGSQVDILLVCGRPGPISNHRPEVCYAGIGFKPLAGRKPLAVPLASSASGRPAEFSLVNFQKESAAVPTYLRIVYGWNAGGDWTAPEGDPRLVFASESYLYKLYVTREMSTPDAPVADDPCLKFLRAFAPQAEATLFPARRPAS